MSLYFPITVTAGILVLLAGCGESVDWRAEAEQVRRDKADANRIPEFKINWEDHAERKRVLASREYVVRKREQSAWESKMRDEERGRSIQEMHEAALREQAEWIANNSSPGEAGMRDASEAIRIARREGKIEWLEGSLGELQAKEMLLPEVVEVRRIEAERIVQETTATLNNDPKLERKQRVFDFFDRMRMSDEERQKREAQRAETLRQAREHGLGEIQQLSASTDLQDLRYVCLKGREITDDSLALLAGNETVKLLHLDHASVGVAGFNHLKSVPNLRILVIERMLLSDKVVAQLRQALPQVAIHYLPPAAQPPAKPVEKQE